MPTIFQRQATANHTQNFSVNIFYQKYDTICIRYIIQSIIQIHSFQWGLCYSIFSVMCMFCRSLVVLFLFGHCVVCPSSIDRFWYFGIFKQDQIRFSTVLQCVNEAIQLYCTDDPACILSIIGDRCSLYSGYCASE